MAEPQIFRVRVPSGLRFGFSLCTGQQLAVSGGAGDEWGSPTGFSGGSLGMHCVTPSVGSRSCYGFVNVAIYSTETS